MANTYYTLENVKQLLGETTNDNNDKINQYGAMADNKINIAHQNIHNVIVPLAEPIPQLIHDLADQIAMGYFYKFESGSTDIIEQGLADLIEYIDTTYRRIKFTTVSRPSL